MSLKVFSAFPGCAQPKISTWFSNQKGFKKKVRIKHEHLVLSKFDLKGARIKHEHFFMFARLKTL